MSRSKISFVVPCYNEEDVIPELYRRLSAVSDGMGDFDFEFMLVNDGSRDGTAPMLDALAERDPRVKVLHLARNRGHQAALVAGLDFADADYVVTIDADLQDPPELTAEMVAKLKQGFDIVHMQRRSRKGEGLFKRFTAWLFYTLMERFTSHGLIRDSGDFRAFNRKVLMAARQFREPHVFLRGIFPMLGFRSIVLKYDRLERHAGTTKYPLSKMMRLAADAVISFSPGPIRFMTLLSVLMWGASLVYLGKALVEHFVFHTTVQGWTSIIILMTFYTGIIIFCMSIIAAYIGRIFEQGQGRPIYWLSGARNVDFSAVDSDIREVGLSRTIVEEGPD